MVEKVFFMDVWKKIIKHFNENCVSVLYAKNLQCWKNYALCIFSKVIKKGKLWKFQKSKMSNQAFFKNAQLDVFCFFTSIFLSLLKIYTRHCFFNNVYFLHISPLLQPIEIKTMHLTIIFCGKTCCFGKTITFFFFFNNFINFELWPMKSLFQQKKVHF